MRLHILINHKDSSISVEELVRPLYVKRHQNGLIVPCNEAEASGVISETGDIIYQLDGKAPLGGDFDTAIKITFCEFIEKETLLRAEQENSGVDQS